MIFGTGRKFKQQRNERKRNKIITFKGVLKFFSMMKFLI